MIRAGFPLICCILAAAEVYVWCACIFNAFLAVVPLTSIRLHVFPAFSESAPEILYASSLACLQIGLERGQKNNKIFLP